MATVANPSTAPQVSPRTSACGAERAAALKKLEIDYIPNASFQFSGLTALPLPTDRLADNERLDTIPAGLPAHLSRLCESGLLTREDEAEFFRQMNFLKFLASELRSRLDPTDPNLHIMDTIDVLLGQARQIRDGIIHANMRLVMSVVKKFVTPYQSFDELLSEGTMTLMHAVEKFDYDRGFRFSTYAYRSIARTAFRFVSAARQDEARLTRDADEWAFGQTDDDQASTMSDQLWNGLRDFTRDMLQRLDKRERLIIRSRFALGSHRRVRSFQDLADRLGVSKERVRQLEARALGKLKVMAQEFDGDDVRLNIG